MYYNIKDLPKCYIVTMCNVPYSKATSDQMTELIRMLSKANYCHLVIFYNPCTTADHVTYFERDTLPLAINNDTRLHYFYNLITHE